MDHKTSTLQEQSSVPSETPAITFESFKDNFDDYKLQHQEAVHPEYFYASFYEKHIQPQISTLFTEEEKKEWIEEWNSALDGELDGEELTFEEILEGYDYLTEDITEYVINSDLPNLAELKEKFIEELFVELSSDNDKR